MEKVALSVEQQVPSNEGRARDRDEIKATLRNTNSPMHVACLKNVSITFSKLKCMHVPNMLSVPTVQWGQLEGKSVGMAL